MNKKQIINIQVSNQEERNYVHHNNTINIDANDFA